MAETPLNVCRILQRHPPLVRKANVGLRNRGELSSVILSFSTNRIEMPTRSFDLDFKVAVNTFPFK